MMYKVNCEISSYENQKSIQSDGNVIYLFSQKPKVISRKNKLRKDPVVAIKDVEIIHQAKDYFFNKDQRYKALKLRNYTLFVVGINVGLRGGDLTRILVSDVLSQDGTIKDDFVLFEEKTGKRRTITLNPNVKEAIQLYINTKAMKKKVSLQDYLFESRNRGENGSSPITVRQAQNIMKELQGELNLDININTHSMRKTFGYHKIKNSQDPYTLATLRKVFNHSNDRVTLSYIGIEDDTIKDFYLNGAL